MTNSTPQRRGRRGSGREAKRARASAGIDREPYIKRKLPYFDILDEEGLATIETNAETILSEIGIDFRDDPDALQMWKEALRSVGKTQFWSLLMAHHSYVILTRVDATRPSKTLKTLSNWPT